LANLPVSYAVNRQAEAVVQARSMIVAVLTEAAARATRLLRAGKSRVAHGTFFRTLDTYCGWLTRFGHAKEEAGGLPSWSSSSLSTSTTRF
jgi:hypothetical protein